MAADAVTLPPGFVLDGPQPQPQLPPGFVLDDSEIRLSNPTEPSLWQTASQQFMRGVHWVSDPVNKIESGVANALGRVFPGGLGGSLLPKGSVERNVVDVQDRTSPMLSSPIRPHPLSDNPIEVPLLSEALRSMGVARPLPSPLELDKFMRGASREVEAQVTPGNIGLAATGGAIEKGLGKEALALASKVFGPYFGTQALSQVPEKVRQGDYGGAAVDVGIGAAGTVGPSFIKEPVRPKGPTPTEFSMKAIEDLPMVAEPQGQGTRRPVYEPQQTAQAPRTSMQDVPIVGQRPIRFEDAPRPTPEIVKPGPTFKGEPKQGGQVSFEGQGVPSAMQAKQMVPPTKYRSGPSVDPEDLRPAINFGGRLLIGEKGDTHADVLERNGIKPDDIPHPDSRRGFASIKNPQQFLDRSQAQQATGIKGTADAGGLDSMDLPGASMHRLEALMKKPQKYSSGIAPDVFKKREEELRGGLFLSTPRLMTTAKEIGFTDTTKEVDAQQLWNRVRNKLPAEAKMLEDIGVDKTVTAKGKISPQEAARLVQEQGPRVEIKTKTKEAQDPTKTALAQVQHELDTRLPTWRTIGNEAAPTQEIRDLLRRESELNRELRSSTHESSDTTHWSSIAPKPESEMPGYVEGAVTIPYKETTKNVGSAFYRDPSQLFPRSHSFPPNTLGFFRGYMETTPEGKKVFHVLEVQSDWAQRVRDIKSEQRSSTGQLIYGRKEGATKYEHPLLKHWERLTLKAAVEHALKEGADEVAVQDAESAMMMEGHDRVHETDLLAVRGGGFTPETESDFIKQSQGMRLHYDRILPGILKELTGQEGKKVSFGEHKMAFETREELARWHPPLTEEELTSTKLPRKDLVFRNPDSTPKTDVSALSYPLKDVKPPMSLLEKDKPSSRPTYYYSGIPLPELEKAWDSMRKWFVGTVEPNASKWSPMINPDTMRRELLSKDSTANPISSKQAGLTLPSTGPDTTFGDRLAATGDAFKKAIALTQDLVNKGDKIYSPMDVIFDRLDGGKATFDGPLFRNVRWPLDFDFNNELNLRQKHTDPVKQLIDKYKLKDKNGQRLGVYAAVQQGARDRLIENGVPSTYIDNVMKTITPQEKEVYRMARRQLDQLLPGVQAVAKDVYGIDVQPVENYFPMQRDWRQTKKEVPELVKPRGGIDPIQDEAVQFLNLDFTKRGTKAEQGFTQKRLPNAKTAVKLNFFDVYERHVRDVSHFVSSQKRLNDIAKIVRDDAFQEKYGDFGQKLTMDWLNTYAKQGRNINTIRSIDWLRKAEARGVLGFRVASQLVHLSNVPLAMGRAGPVWWTRGLQQAIGEEGQNFIRKNLAETFERGGGELELLEKQGKIAKAAFEPQRFFDRWNSQATTLGIYLRELEKKGLDWQEFSSLPVDQQALAQARVLARRAVASPLYKDLPPALTYQAGKVLMQYQNTFMDQWSNIRYDLPQYLQNNPRQAMGLFIALTGMVLAESGIKYGVKKGEHALTSYHPKTDKEDTYWKKVYHETLRRVPGYSQAEAMTEFGHSGVPLQDIAIQEAEAIKTAVKAEDKPGRVLAGVQAGAGALELFPGVPGIGQANTYVQDALKAKYFKPHEQRIEEYAKEKNLDLSKFPQRVQAEREYKAARPSQSEAEKVKGAQGAIKKMAGHRQEAINQLSKEDRTWLKTNGVEPPGFGDSLTISKVRVAETDAEVEYAERRYSRAYSEAIAFLRNHDGFKQGNPATKQAIANKVFHDFLKSAKQEVTAKVESGELVKKEKKKRFSVFGP